MDNKFERVEDDHPNRCQGGGVNGQCPYKAVPNSKYCPRHGGNNSQSSSRAMIKRQYDLAQWQAKTDHFSEHDSLKSLKDEVAILRVVLQNIIQLCKTDTDLMMFAPRISDIISDIKSTVVAMHRLDTNLGVMLDRTAAISLAANMVDIITEEIADPALAERIGKRFAILVLNTKGDEDVEQRNWGTRTSADSP